MSAARLYAVEIDRTIVTVRAAVWFDPSDSECIEVDVEALCGVRVEQLRWEPSDEDWDAVRIAVIDQAYELGHLAG